MKHVQKVNLREKSRRKKRIRRRKHHELQNSYMCHSRAWVTVLATYEQENFQPVRFEMKYKHYSDGVSKEFEFLNLFFINFFRHLSF